MSSSKRAFASLQPSDSLDHLENPKKKLKPSSNPSLELFALLRPSPFTLNIFNEPSSNGPLAINYQENTISAGSSEANNYNFNKIFEVQTSQEELMKTLALPLLEDLLSQGKSGLIFSYAPTNIERTSVFLGSTAEPGVLPHSIKMLLDMKAKVTQERLQKALKGVTQNLIETNDDKGKMSEEAKKSPKQDNREKIVEMKVYLEAFEVDNQGYYDLLKDAKKGKLAHQNNKFMGNRERSRQPALLKDIVQIELTSEQQAVKVLTNCRKNLEADDSLLLGSNSQSHITFRITIKYSFKNSPKNLFFFNTNSSSDSQITASLCLVALGRPQISSKPSLNKQPNSSSKAKPSNSPLGKTPLGPAKVNLQKENKLAKVIGRYLSAENNLRLITQLHANPLDLEETLDVLNYSMKFKDPSFLNPVNETLPLSASKGNNSISPKDKSGEWENEAGSRHQSSKKKNGKKSDEQIGRVKGKENKKGNVKKEEGTEENPMKRSSLLKKATPSAKFYQARESQSAINERDMRIQILEDALQKLQEKLLMECIGGKIKTMNENFKSSMQEISSSIDKISPIPPVGLNPECFEFKNQQEGSIESFFERIQLNATASMVPVNINYFIFPGQMDKEGMESLSKVLNKDQGGSSQQNHVYVVENMTRSQLMTKSQMKMETPRKEVVDVVDVELEEFRKDQIDAESVFGVENLL